MERLLKNVKVEQEHRLYPVYGTVQSLALEKGDKSEFQPPSFGVRYDYFASFTLGFRFQANKVELSHKSRHAVDSMRHMLYQEILPLVNDALATADEPTREPLLQAMRIMKGEYS